MLKAQNSAAQAAIQGALNGPDHPPKGILKMVSCVIPYSKHWFYVLVTVKFHLLNGAILSSK